MTAVERVIARALGEVGYEEKADAAGLDDAAANAGSGNYTKYARDLDALGVYNGGKQGYEWCDVFADWCYIMEFGKDLGLRLICQPERSYGAGVNSSARYYRQAGRLDDQPRTGDQIYFIDSSDGLYYHTGIVVDVDDAAITTVEGNASDTVARRRYAHTDPRIGAFGHPRWELVEDAPTIAPQTPIEDEGAPIAVGDTVRLKEDAVVYGSERRFSPWVYNTDLYVRSVSGDRVTVSTLKEGAVTGRVHAKYLRRLSAAAVPNDVIRVGDTVRLKEGAKVYGKDYGFSPWVYSADLYVRSISGDRAVVSPIPRGAVTGSVDVRYLYKV